jgi:hypothetical protein
MRPTLNRLATSCSAEQVCYRLHVTSRNKLMTTSLYTRENAEVVTGLQTSCPDKSVHKLSTLSCVRTACS